jgi:hypothetical protein
VGIIMMATDRVLENQLIGECLQGDASAFGELVRRYQDRLYNSAYRLVGNAEDAQDVVQVPGKDVAELTLTGALVRVVEMEAYHGTGRPRVRRKPRLQEAPLLFARYRRQRRPRGGHKAEAAQKGIAAAAGR